MRDTTHWQRRKGLLRAVADEAIGQIWARTTSTLIMRSKRQAQDLLTTLVYKAEHDDRDRVFLVDITSTENAH